MSDASGSAPSAHRRPCASGRDGDTHDDRIIERTDILGGLIHEYHQAA